MEKMKLTFVNVGYGEAMVLECPDSARPGRSEERRVGKECL